MNLFVKCTRVLQMEVPGSRISEGYFEVRMAVGNCDNIDEVNLPVHVSIIVNSVT